MENVKMYEISSINFDCASANVRCNPKTCKVCKATKAARRFIKFVFRQTVKMLKVLLFVAFVCVFLPISFVLYVLKSIFTFLYDSAEKMAGKPLRRFMRWANK